MSVFQIPFVFYFQGHEFDGRAPCHKRAAVKPSAVKRPGHEKHLRAERSSAEGAEFDGQRAPGHKQAAAVKRPGHEKHLRPGRVERGSPEGQKTPTSICAADLFPTTTIHSDAAANPHACDGAPTW